MAKSEEFVKEVIQRLTDIYDLNNSKVDVIDKGDYNLITLNNKGYTIYPTTDNDVDDIVSYIVADQNLQPKTISKVEENNQQINEGLEDIVIPSSLSEDYPSLLIALESEKDAEITYKSLIEIEKSSDKPNQQVIDLLEKILKDELEHIALLSALSANKNSEYVAEDSQEQFDDYIDATQNGDDIAEGLDDDTSEHIVDDEQTIEGNIFKYNHDDSKDHVFDTVDDELKEISKHNPYCIVNNVVTADDGSQYAEVTFDIPKNSNIDLPYSGEYVVTVDELTAV